MDVIYFYRRSDINVEMQLAILVGVTSVKLFQFTRIAMTAFNLPFLLQHTETFGVIAVDFLYTEFILAWIFFSVSLSSLIAVYL